MLKSSNNYNNFRSFKDHYLEKKILTHRVIVAFIFVFIMFCYLLVQAWYLQVTKFKDYQTRSNNNRISVLPITPKRGLIYDRNGVLLADNRSIYSLEIIPEQVKDLDVTLSHLTKIGLIDSKLSEDFLTRLRGHRRFKSIVLKNGLSEKDVARFAVDRHLLTGVKIEARLVRYYPFAQELVHALGYVGRINERELARIDQSNYKATRHIGKVGIEKFYEKILHGTIGSRQIETDVQGRQIGKPLFENLPIPGKNLKLSLDIRLQQIAVKALGDNQGSVVVIDPRNGEVLALVSMPGYNPNKFVTGISTVDYKKLIDSGSRPLFNRALRGLYSPGSTIKPLLGWAGLEAKMITINSSINDPGYWIIPNEEKRVYRDWKRKGHGKNIKLTKAIVESCDPYFYDLAYRMGIDTLSFYMNKFGFGQATEIDMGEEVPGIMPSREWKMRKRNAQWYPGETVITGIGQGYWLSTPLQLASAVGQISVGGTRYQLRLVSHIQASEDWQNTSPVAAKNQQDFSNAKNLNIIQEAMLKVTKFPYGTAKMAFRKAKYQSAGKTGTVQLVTQLEEKYDETKVAKHLRDNAVYIGYAPTNKPQIAIAVILENAGHGGSQAAPVARAIFDEYFKNKVIESKSLTQNAKVSEGLL